MDFIRRIRRIAAALGLIAASAGGKAYAKGGVLSRRDVVMVSDTTFNSADPYDVIDSNISVVNALFKALLRPEEISRVALTSYYVDYYLVQVTNGGFSQFVFNSGWTPAVVRHVRDGLRQMGAQRHLALFEEGVASVERMGSTRLAAYIESRYFGENADRDILNGIDDRFYKLSETEDLVKLNSTWIKTRPNLLVLPIAKIEEEIDRRAAAIPDRAAREAAVREAEPRYSKLIRALCEKSGHTFVQVNAGDRMHYYDGKSVRELTAKEADGRPSNELQMTWFFRTDKGIFMMIEANGKAAMFDRQTKNLVAEIDAPE